MKNPYLLNARINRRTPQRALMGWLFFVLLIGNAWAQIEPCGTEATPEQIEYMTRTREARQRYQIPELGSRNNTQVPIKAHIIRRSNGSGGLTEGQLNNAIAFTNIFYQNANIEFYLCGPVNYIDSDTYFDFDSSEEEALTGANNQQNVINIYFANSTRVAGTRVCGYAYFPGGPDVIMMDNGCTTDRSTLPHELGHYFSLYHTHGKTNCGITDELVNGSNCNAAGDDICDTPADPNLRGLNCQDLLHDENCNYNGTLVDANGQAYDPQVNNIMSYAAEPCPDMFTQGQYQRMAFSLQNERNYLTCNDNPPPPPGGELDCSNAVQLACGQTYNGTTIGKPSNVQDYGNCGEDWQESGPEAVHVINWPGGAFSAQLSNLNEDLDLALLNSCDVNDCVTIADEVINVELGPGTYYLVVDGYEGAQSTYSLTIGDCDGGGGNQPDYTATNFNGPNNATAGSTIVMTLTVQNLGDAAGEGGNGRDRFYFSDRPDLNGNVEELKNFPTGDLAAGASFNVTSGDLTLPNNVADGTYYILFFIDADNAINESNENNNLVSHQITIGDGGGGGGELDCSNAVQLACGQTYNGTTIGKPSNVQDYSNCNTDWVESGPEAVHVINWPGGAFSAQLSNLNEDLDLALLNSCDVNDCVTIADEVINVELGPGTYYLVVDGYEGAQSTYSLTIGDCDGGGGGDPDYVVVDFQVNGSTDLNASPGQQLTGNLFARNNGEGAGTVRTTGKYYFSSDNNLDASDPVLGTNDIEPLAPGQQTPEEEVFTIPNTANIGSTYYLFYKIDADNLINESNEGNNVELAFIRVVGAPPNANFSANSTNVCVGSTVSFTNQSSGAPTSYTWNFSPGSVTYVNGTNASSANPQVRFNAAGSYTVSLRATNASGSDTETKAGYISVSNSVTPTVSISANRNDICPGESITLSANVNGGGGSPTYQWKVNGNNVGSDATYTSSNFNNGDQVQLVITSSSPCASPRTATSNTVVISVQANCGGPDWPVTPTGDNHTVIVQANIPVMIDGMPIVAGDYLGVAFQDNGTERFAGKAAWTGRNTSVTVYGDDSSTPQKDGLAAGEPFSWRLWKASTGQTYEGTATYQPTDAIITHTDQFAADGLSSLASLMGSSEQSQQLQLQPGWNMISTHIQASSPDLASIFAPLQTDIALVKNGTGQIYFPSGGINSIGNWQVTEGYKVRLLGNTPRTLEITGQKVSAATTPINLGSGWNLIAYFGETDQPVQQALAPIVDKIILVKNNAGDIFSPTFGINNIGDLQPGQGYQVRMESAGVLTYGTRRAEALNGPVSLHTASLNARNYRLGLHSDNNATFILEANESLQWGDEIGLFSPEGRLVGAGVYEHHALAITLWGQEGQAGSGPGLATGEGIELRVWRASEQREWTAPFDVLQGDATYQPDGFTHASMARTTLEVGALVSNSLALFPNPAKGVSQLRLQLTEAASVQVQLYNLNGQKVHSLKPQQLAAGQHELELAIAHLAEGVYRCQVVVGSQQHGLNLSILR